MIFVYFSDGEVRESRNDEFVVQLLAPHFLADIYFFGDVTTEGI